MTSDNKLETQSEINDTMKLGLELLKENDIDPSTAQFAIIQQYNDSQAIMVNLTEKDGDRKLEVKVFDSVVVLPKKDAKLDIFY